MNKIKINIIYISNFNFKTNYDNKNNFLFKRGGKIACKNFLLTLLLIKYVFKQTNIKLFVLPNSKSNFTILRAPYRHKLTRHQLSLVKFFLNLKITLLLKEQINIVEINQLNLFLKELKNFIKFFETNIISQKKIKITFQCSLKNNWNILMFKKSMN